MGISKVVPFFGFYCFSRFGYSSKLLNFSIMEGGRYSKELDVAVRVVHLACSLCQKVQEGLATTNSDQVKSKDDDSPVTVAGTLK